MAVESFVREWGAGPGVLLLHGWAQDERYWEPLAEELMGDFRLIAVNAQGLLLRAVDPATNRGLLAAEVALETLVRRYGEDWNLVAVVGHSMGGRFVVAAAEALSATHDVGMVFLSTPFHPIALPKWAPSSLRGVRRVLGFFLSLPVGLRGAIVRLFYRQMVVIPEGVTEPMIAAAQEMDVELAADLLHDLTRRPFDLTGKALPGRPGMIIHGSQDPLASPHIARNTAELLGWAFHSLEGTGHSPSTERPGEVARLLRDFTAMIRGHGRSSLPPSREFDGSTPHSN